MDFGVFNDYIEEILDALCVDFKHSGNKFLLKCPIHNSDKTKLYIYPSGVWACYTRHCEDEWGKGIIGFTRGVLNQRDNLNLDFLGTVKWLCKNLNIPYTSSKPDKITLNKKNFISEINEVCKDIKDIEYTKISKDVIKKRLKIPSKYFLKRGYSAKYLEQYYVGDCEDSTKPFYNRAVVPIFNHQDYAIGFIARSIFEKCKKCDGFHNPEENCPFYKQLVHEKWINTNFEKTQILFNYWNAISKIEEKSSVIITESFGDCMKLIEAKIDNSVALLGSFMSTNQKILLEKLNINELILLLNNDEAGKSGMKKICEECGKLYNIRIPKLEKNDLGDMNIEEIRSLLKND